MSKLDLQIKKLGSTIEQELPRLAEQSERIDRERFTGATALGASSAGKLRLLSLRPVTNKRGTGGEEQGLVAEYYDAERNQCIVIQSGASNEEPTVKTTARQPLPDFAEFAEACRVLEKHEVFGPAVRAGHARLYRPMPPMKLSGAGIAPTRRAINVGILPDASTSLRHEIVAVGSADGAVERFSNGAPPNAEAGPTACGPQNTVQQTASRGTAGRVELTVTDGDTELWRLTAVRPAESSGTNGSGIELLDVRYRGRMVLKRAHLPILNVLYPPGDHGCGPSYRDWQWEEGQIRAEGIHRVT